MEYKMNRSPKRQQGLTIIALVFILGLIAFFILLGLTIGPIYLDHHKVVGALSELEQVPDIEKKSETEIRDSLSKRFNINYVYDVNQDDITVTKQGGHLKVLIEYEVVRKIAGNLSVLVEFNDKIEVGQE
jgi:DNA-dependent RNA polymerase auxiliary subunit epsilon